MELDGVDLEFEDGALGSDCREGHGEKDRSQGVKGHHGRRHHGLMYQVPSDEKVSKCVITRGVVESSEEPVIERSNDRSKRTSGVKKRTKKSNGEIA